MNTEQYLSQIKLSSYVKFPKYIMIVFLIVSLFMIINFILDKYHIYKIKGGINGLKNEIVELKAKLYDQNPETVKQIEEPSEDEDDLLI